jgi:predicted anti-sigma-YlaC factor YlaD
MIILQIKTIFTKYLKTEQLKNNFKNLNIMEKEQNNEGQQVSPNQTFIINQPETKKSNSIGTAGFVLAIIALFLSWVPVLGWVLWVLGLIFSFVGVFRQPKGLSIAGLVISCIALIVLIVVVGAIAAAI